MPQSEPVFEKIPKAQPRRLASVSRLLAPLESPLNYFLFAAEFLF